MLKKRPVRGYRQLLAEALATGDIAAASDLRMQIGAASLEMCRENGLDQAQLEPRLADLWVQNSAVEESAPNAPQAVAETLRRSSVRLALMLAESRLAQSKWDEAFELDQVIVDRYSDHPDCLGEVGEAYCHLAHVWAERRDFAEVERCARSAIAIADELGRPVWGDIKIDVCWKAHTWYLVAARVTNQPADTITRIENEMRRRFPTHPGLKLFVP